MNVSESGWLNKKGTAERICGCGSWKNHWLNYANTSWPSFCSVYGCVHFPSLGAHVHNPDVSGEKIVPMCNVCNGLNVVFKLNVGVTPINANKAETCDK